MALITDLPTNSSPSTSDYVITDDGSTTYKSTIADITSNKINGTTGLVNASSSITFTATIAVAICFNGSGLYALFGFRNGSVATMVSSTSAITATANGTTYTINNGVTTSGMRYVILTS